MSLRDLVQEYRCPEAHYYPIGELMLIGKGSSWYFRVVGRKSANVLLIKFIKTESGNRERNNVAKRAG